jgi:hypothetical protein
MENGVFKAKIRAKKRPVFSGQDAFFPQCVHGVRFIDTIRISPSFRIAVVVDFSLNNSPCHGFNVDVFGHVPSSALAGVRSGVRTLPPGFLSSIDID